MTKGLQSYSLYSDYFNSYNYVDFNNGNFRIDFEEWAHLTGGQKLLIVFAVDKEGRTGLSMNILNVPVYYPDLLDEIDQSSSDFAERMDGLSEALTDVITVSGRDDDIALLEPYMEFIQEAFGEGYDEKNWDTAADNLLDGIQNASSLIGDQDYRLMYELVGEYVADRYKFKNFMAWSTHYVTLEAQGETYRYERNLAAVQRIIDGFNEFDEQYTLTDRGNGVLELTVDIYYDMDVIAQFSVIGDPSNPLVVTGFIGEHTIVSGDYNPYFFSLFGIFQDEGINWPPVEL